MLPPDNRPVPITVYNGISTLFGITGKLNYDKLLKEAIRNTGLNFLGNDFNEQALNLLIQSINNEARLHPFGNLMIREKIIGQLENRLWAEHWFKKYPEILEQQLLPIVMVTGLQRTGTTWMQRLLSKQEGARGLHSWEALYPAPIKSADESKIRLRRTKRNERAIRFISPEFQKIHPIHADQPEEDVLLLDVHFMSSSSEAILHVPSYASWLEEQDHSEAYLYEKKLLQLLQWQQTGSFWVLKTPHHLQYLDLFKKTFPESHIIWMHRELKNCLPSYLSMLYLSRAMFTEHVNKDDLKSHWFKKLSLMLNNGMEYRIENKESIIDVLFNNFIKDETSQVCQILGLTGSGKKAISNNSENKIPYKSKHKYSLEDWDINIDRLDEQFSNYNELVLSMSNR